MFGRRVPEQKLGSWAKKAGAQTTFEFLRRMLEMCEVAGEVGAGGGRLWFHREWFRRCLDGPGGEGWPRREEAVLRRSKGQGVRGVWLLFSP